MSASPLGRTARPTQRSRVLARLELVGSRGVSPDDFLLPNVCDGGNPILRLAARIHDLAEAGNTIATERRKNGVTAYVLSASVQAAAPITPSVHQTPAADETTEQMSVFDVLDHEAA